MELMTVNEVAKFLKLTPRTVRNWRDRKKDFRETSIKMDDEIRFIKSKVENWVLSLSEN